MATATTKVPEIYKAMAKVLAAMQVAKNGQLPGNMGGKSYITAVDASAEAKRQFVENDIVIVPHETVTHHEVTDSGSRKMVVIGIEAEYTLISTKDGSSVVIGGVGDGTALGTSVASNIASTNALKNALLRTFLITEQSVEDQAKNGEDEKPQPRAVQQAQSGGQKPVAKAPAAKKTGADAVRGQIKEKYLDTGEISLDALNEMVTRIQNETVNHKKDEKLYKDVLAALDNGERK